MNSYERVRKLAAKRNISIAELERILKLSNGMISKWAKSKPTSEPLTKVADFFNVSTDYLLGRTEDPFFGVTEYDLRDLIDYVASYDSKPISDFDRAMLKAYLEGKFSDR